MSKGGEDATLVVAKLNQLRLGPLYTIFKKVTHFPRLYRLETSGQVAPFTVVISFRVVPTFATVVDCKKTCI